jgi:hypothetical protein
LDGVVVGMVPKEYISLPVYSSKDEWIIEQQQQINIR